MAFVSSEPIVLIGPGSEWFWTAVSGLVLGVTFLAIWRQLRVQASANTFAQLQAFVHDLQSGGGSRVYGADEDDDVEDRHDQRDRAEDAEHHQCRPYNRCSGHVSVPAQDAEFLLYTGSKIRPRARNVNGRVQRSAPSSPRVRDCHLTPVEGGGITVEGSARGDATQRLE
jgi:hypothetical protein